MKYLVAGTHTSQQKQWT